MKNPKDIFKEYQKLNQSLLKEDSDQALLFQGIQNGTREYTKVHRNENTAADISWVKKVEDGVNHITSIIANPRSFIKSVSYLVPAELAKRTGPESVVHLATHSQYVKKIEKNGDVIPSKVLTSEGELDVQIYENRFIMCLIKRLRMYIEKRYIYLKHFAQLSDLDIFYLNNTFKIGDTTVNYNSTLTLSTPSDSLKFIREKVNESLGVVENLRKYISFFTISDFMKVQMKGARPIIPPVMQTNMIRSQPDYHAAYDLWMFLNEEEHVSMDFVVDEEVKALSKDEQERIDLLNYLTTLDLLNINQMKTARYTKEKYTSSVVTNIDDILCLNDKFTTPYEFIRTDEQYYLDQAKPIIQREKGKSPKVVKAAFKIDNKKLAELEKQKKEALAVKRRKEALARKEKAAMERQRLADIKEIQLREQAEQERLHALSLDELNQLRKEVTSIAKQDAKVIDKNPSSILDSLAKEEVKEDKIEGEAKPADLNEQKKEEPAEVKSEDKK